MTVQQEQKILLSQIVVLDVMKPHRRFCFSSFLGRETTEVNWCGPEEVAALFHPLWLSKHLISH